MSHRLRPITAVSAALLLALALPAPRAARAADGPSALHGGAWSVEFDKDMGSSYFADNEISIKRMSSATTGFRFGFGVSYSGGSGFGTRTDTPSGTMTPYGQGNFNRNYTLRLDWVKHFALSSNFDGQLGIGPVASFYNYSSSYQEGTYSSQNYNRTRMFGGEINLGAEWFFTNRFSLGGRVGLVAMTGKYKNAYRYISGGNGYDESVEYTQNRVFGDPARIILTAHL